MAQVIALNLRKKLLNNDLFISKADIAPQDMTFQDEKLKRVKRMMKKHPGLNPMWDPEVKSRVLDISEPIMLQPSTSRQVRRQAERIAAKQARTHFTKLSKKHLNANERIVRIKDEKTGMISYRVGKINRPTVTLITTGRYMPHQSTGVRYSSNGQRSRV